MPKSKKRNSKIRSANLSKFKIYAALKYCDIKYRNNSMGTALIARWIDVPSTTLYQWNKNIKEGDTHASQLFEQQKQWIDRQIKKGDKKSVILSLRVKCGIIHFLKKASARGIWELLTQSNLGSRLSDDPVEVKTALEAAADVVQLKPEVLRSEFIARIQTIEKTEAEIT